MRGGEKAREIWSSASLSCNHRHGRCLTLGSRAAEAGSLARQLGRLELDLRIIGIADFHPAFHGACPPLDDHTRRQPACWINIKHVVRARLSARYIDLVGIDEEIAPLDRLLALALDVVDEVW